MGVGDGPTLGFGKFKVVDWIDDNQIIIMRRGVPRQGAVRRGAVGHGMAWFFVIS